MAKRRKSEFIEMCENNLPNELSPQNVLVYGTSGHARVVVDALRMQGRYEVAGYLDDTLCESLPGSHLGLPILGGEFQLAQLFLEGHDTIIPAFGDSQGRIKLIALAESIGFDLGTVIHPRATLAGDVDIKGGTVVLAGAVINTMSSVGKAVIVNTGAGVDHDCCLEDGSHIGPGVHLGGGVFIGRGAWIGIGATIKDRVRIGAGAIVGAGSLVLSDIPSNVVAYGVPAKIQRELDHRA